MYSVYELKECEKRANTLIIFSGGLDSTLLLLNKANEISGTEEVIYTAYLDTQYLNDEKKTEELKARKRIIKKIKKDYNVLIEDIIIKINGSKGICYNKLDDYDFSHDRRINGQSMLWSSLVMNILPSIVIADLEIQFGHLLDDQFSHMTATMIKDTIESWSRNLYGGNKITVTFPLILNNKSLNIYSMMNLYPDYMKLTWSCEIPDSGKPCGKCVPCITRNISLIKTAIDFGGSELDISKKLSNLAKRSDKYLKQMIEKHKVDNHTNNDKMNDNEIQNLIDDSSIKDDGIVYVNEEDKDE